MASVSYFSAGQQLVQAGNAAAECLADGFDEVWIFPLCGIAYLRFQPVAATGLYDRNLRL